MNENRPAFAEIDLPPPARAAHAALIERLIARMASRGGRISYAEYVDMALFEPGLGYYDSGHVRFDEHGDFVTAPEISPLFSRALALHAVAVLRELGAGAVLEFGAGAGTMAAEILLTMEREDRLPEHYFIVERATQLRARQRQTIAERAPRLLTRVTWLDAAPPAFEGVMLANELLDALPVHKIRLRADAPAQEYFVAHDAQHGLRWALADIADAATAALAAAIRIDWERCPAPYYDTEVHPAAQNWLRDAGACLARGAILLVDYGYPRHEYYVADRYAGTIQCFFRHRAHADPLLLTGLQDITAHVEFSTLAETAQSSGLRVAGFTTQAHFLLGCGIEYLAQGALSGNAAATLPLLQQIKQLVLPTGMGEMFKVLALTREFTGELPGFRFNNRLDRL